MLEKCGPELVRVTEKGMVGKIFLETSLYLGRIFVVNWYEFV